MKICGIELELDIFDADVVEKYENALETMSKKAKSVESKKASDSIRQQCQLVYDCFDDIFGQGTADKVFQGKKNLVVCLKAFEEMVEQVGEQKHALDDIVLKYSPERVQRGHVK